MNDLSNAVGKEQSEKDQAFKRFVNQFGTHFVEETQLGAKIYYERRFTKRSTSVTTGNTRKDCVGKAAEGCTGGNFEIFFISANAETCPSKETQQCTVSLSGVAYLYIKFNFITGSLLFRMNFKNFISEFQIRNYR